MSRYKVGDVIVCSGKRGRVVWVRENSNEIEAMDEYILQFDDNEKQFFISSELDQITLGRIA